MLAQAAAIHFTTTEEAQLAGELTAAAPHVIVPNGLDLSRFSQVRSRDTFRMNRLGGFAGDVVLFLGRIARKKGIDLLIQAFAQATQGRDAVLVIAGPDDESLTAELVPIAEALGISERVHFVGPVYGDHQLEALAAADVWALTSHTENFGNAVLEAMAAGLPVLVSTEVNVASQIAAAHAGVVTSLSVDEIAAALRSLLDSPDRRSVLRSRARTFAQQFDWSIVAPELVRTFRQVAERVRVP
jgi:glycosyltransferase involved in cell wall biosynthesis